MTARGTTLFQRGLMIDIPDLGQHLRQLLGQVPAGRVTTYGRLAEALGAATAARWVATFLLDPESAAGLPCHRVVLRDGRLGSYFTGNIADKARLLAAEGIQFRAQCAGERRGVSPMCLSEVADQVVDLARYGFADFVSPHPLQELRRMQEELLADLRLEPPAELPEFAAGVDVSYISPTDAVVGYALIEVSTGRLAWSMTHRQRVTFPYIPTYLSFRELPLLLEILQRAADAGRLAEVVLVDGAGILHQRHAGIATHLGIVTGLATIGITKQRLCGQVHLDGMTAGTARPVIHEEQTVAMALQTRSRGKPIYVSPGQRVNIPYALELTRRLLHGHKLPEPVHWAHTLSKRATRVGY